ncbi:hypothetical protein Scep_030169 [Stephania cephalantha]|uniref:AP180 N-terminal homology (ANTH) domain-containing protein n=1 Tax=Stephania cephalantha TaxID=152367 RepID=A0AAP0HCX9_9MAGN
MGVGLDECCRTQDRTSPSTPLHDPSFSRSSPLLLLHLLSNQIRWTASTPPATPPSSSPPSPRFPPPHQNHISVVLSYDFTSRATASLCIHALMDRLHTTRDASVALKCLIIVHNIIKRGSYILQDQLSVCPKYGGKNYLNLSNFKDNSTPHSWALSFWVGWYAEFSSPLCTLPSSRLVLRVGGGARGFGGED